MFRRCIFVGILAVTAASSPVSATGLGFDDMVFWVGSGANQAGLVIHWSAPEVLNNTAVPAPSTDLSLAWGYRFDGVANGLDMLKAIAAADPRLHVVTAFGGSFVVGLGYDLNDDEPFALSNGSLTFSGDDFIAGVLEDDFFDADSFAAVDGEDVYWGGLFGPTWESWHEAGSTGGFLTVPDRGEDAVWTPNDPDAPWSGFHGQWQLADFGLAAIAVNDGSWVGLTVAAGGLVFGDNDNPGTIAHNFGKQAPAAPIPAIPEPASLLMLTVGATTLLRRSRRHPA